MEQYQLTSSVIGAVIALLILWLVRRDHLHGRFALWWIAIAVASGLLGIFPRTLDDVAFRLGIGYPPILAVVLALGFLMIKILIGDIERSRNEIKIHRLTQRLAILEGQLFERDHGEKKHEQV
ncbi:MAG: DUF2304 domain-containing protein [Pseudomonadales bacterium]|nr:DUF2304 domain-containing protein [Pseudomonadales bacterium]